MHKCPFFLEIDNQVLGKTAENIVNFAIPEMTENDKEQLCSRINIDNLKLTAIVDMYSNDLFFSSEQEVEKNEETINSIEEIEEKEEHIKESDINKRIYRNDSSRNFVAKNLYTEKDYVSGLTVSNNRNDKPDFLMPQKINGYSYLNTYNGYYIVEKTKEGEYRYGSSGSLALHARSGNYELEWWSGYTIIENRSIEMKSNYKETYANSPIHPCQDKTANEIMCWLNY